MNGCSFGLIVLVRQAVALPCLEIFPLYRYSLFDDGTYYMCINCTDRCGYCAHHPNNVDHGNGKITLVVARFAHFICI